MQPHVSTHMFHYLIFIKHLMDRFLCLIFCCELMCKIYYNVFALQCIDLLNCFETLCVVKKQWANFVFELNVFGHFVMKSLKNNRTSLFLN